MKKQTIKNSRKFLFCLFLMIFVVGCAYLSIPSDDDTVMLPSSKNEEGLANYNCAVIKGKIISEDKIKNPNLLVAYKIDGDNSTITNFVILGSTSPFMLYLAEGCYQLYTITDFNNDGIYTENEVSGVYGSLSSPEGITLRKGDLLKNVVVRTSKENSEKINFPQRISINERKIISQLTYNGQVSKIYDEKFSTGNASAGWWNPTAFMNAFGAHIYFMEEYDPKKVPILFVHGAEGSPQNWVYFFMRLDRRRYQPWFFYYPSGIHLSLASQILYDELMELHTRYGFKKMCVVAHSIGGLVTHSLLTRYKFDKQNNFVKIYVTFATPWSGFEAADASQKLPHKSLPSWVDLGSQSIFIHRTLNAKLPRDVKYYLFYGKEDMVSEGRALDDRALSNAYRTFGFECNHDSILTDRCVFRKFDEILHKEFYPASRWNKRRR